MFLFVSEIMVQDAPRSKGLLDSFKERAVSHKGQPSIESLAAGKGFVGVGPFNKSKKRSREASNIAKMTRSPGEMLVPPPPLQSLICLDSLSTNDFKCLIPPSTPERVKEV